MEPTKPQTKTKSNITENFKQILIGNPNLILSLSAMAISLFTLFILMYQSHLLSRQFELAKKQQYASVLPYLEIGPSFGSDFFHVYLNNTGVGPAFIKDVYIVADSTYYQLDLFGFISEFSTPEDSLGAFSYSSLYPGRVLQAGAELRLLSTSGSIHDTRHLRNFLFNKAPILVVEFASIYDQRWILDSRFLSTPIPKEDYEPWYIAK